MPIDLNSGLMLPALTPGAPRVEFSLAHGHLLAGERSALAEMISQGALSGEDYWQLVVIAIHRGEALMVQDLLPHTDESPLSLVVKALYTGMLDTPDNQAAIDAAMRHPHPGPANWDEVVGMVQRGFATVEMLTAHAPVEVLHECTRRMPWLSRMKARLDAVELEQSTSASNGSSPKPRM